MDQDTRETERRAARGADPEAAARHARQLLRSGRAREALARVEGASGSAAAAVAATACLELGRPAEAADAAARALAGDPEALADAVLARVAQGVLAEEGGELLARATRVRRCAALGRPGAEAIRPLLADPEPLIRAQVARSPLLGPKLQSDPSALVRYVARGAPPAPRFPREPEATRLFSAWGADFDLGPFVACDLSLEGRLLVLDRELLQSVDALLGPGRRVAAMGLGYGLAVPSGAPRGDLEDRIAAVNAAQVLPFPLVLHTTQPFDDLEVPLDDGHEGDPVDVRLIHRLAADLLRHPARIEAAPEGEPVYARLLGLHPPGGVDPDEAALEELLTLARERYSPLGCRALDKFVRRAAAERSRPKRFRRAPQAPPPEARADDEPPTPHRPDMV